MTFNLVVLNMPCGILELKNCQKKQETFFLKGTKRKIS